MIVGAVLLLGACGASTTNVPSPSRDCVDLTSDSGGCFNASKPYGCKAGGRCYATIDECHADVNCN